MAFDINGSLLAKVGAELRVDKGAVNPMRLTAGGVLRRPVIPFFQGFFTAQGHPTVGTITGAPVPFDSVLNNDGGHWTGRGGATPNRFICPVAGKYMMYIGGLGPGVAQDGGGAGYFGWTKNGAIACYTHWNHQSYWKYCSITGIADCAAGDQLAVAISTYPIGGGAISGLYAQGGHGNAFVVLLK